MTLPRPARLCHPVSYRTVSALAVSRCVLSCLSRGRLTRKLSFCWNMWRGHIP